jgi:hypothetical protein
MRPIVKCPNCGHWCVDPIYSTSQRHSMVAAVCNRCSIGLEHKKVVLIDISKKTEVLGSLDIRNLITT